MKRFYFLLLFWTLVSVSGCEKDIRADCADGGEFVKRVDNANGTVYYNSTETKYTIRVANSMDSYDVGYVCSLDTTFQKEGLQVKFSGRYYNYYKTLPVFLAGDRNYSLSIETISVR